MYWYIVAGWSVLGLAVFWGILTTRWDAKVQASGGDLLPDEAVSLDDCLLTLADRGRFVNAQM